LPDTDTTPSLPLPAAEIREEISVPQPPRLNGRQAPVLVGEAHSASVSVDPRAEYVSGGNRLWSVNYLRTLAFAVDDVTAEFGADLYERMLLDPRCAADIDTLILAVLADGIHITPAEEPFTTDPTTGKQTQNPKYPLAKEIAEFIGRNLADLSDTFNPETATPLYWSVYDMLRACAFGNRIAEIIYDIPDTGQDRGKLILKGLHVKPRESLVFLVDVYNNILGFVALIPGYGAPVLMQGLVVDPENVPNLLPPDKFAVLTWRGKNNDPRGCSLLRAAYEPWFTKCQIKQERLKWLAQMAGGLLVGKTSSVSVAAQAVDASGNPLLDTHGNPILIQPEQAMLNSLIAVQNGTAIALPPGADLDVHYPQALSPFDAALDRQDREISTAILGQSRMQMEAQHGSKADSQTGQDVFGLRVAQGKRALTSMLQTQIVQRLVRLNYGADALRLCPKVALTATEPHDFAASATAVSYLMRAGYLAPSQFREVDAILGLPVRTEAPDPGVDVLG
jgi:hypothetical protein